MADSHEINCAGTKVTLDGEDDAAAIQWGRDIASDMCQRLTGAQLESKGDDTLVAHVRVKRLSDNVEIYHTAIRVDSTGPDVE